MNFASCLSCMNCCNLSSFNTLTWWSTFQTLNHICLPGIQPNCCIVKFLRILLNFIYQCSITIFCIYIHDAYWSLIILFVSYFYSVSSFRIKIEWFHKVSVSSFPLLHFWIYPWCLGVFFFIRDMDNVGLLSDFFFQFG